MTMLEYTTVDKSGWGEGPWQTEPDKIQWIDEATGFDCLAVRHPRSGHWCGYVGVPPEHPCHGVDYDRVRVPRRDPADEWSDWPEVHSGLTYAAGCQEDGDEAESICHIPQPGRPDNVWWLGFDCAHLGDRSPGYEAKDRERGWDPIGDTHSTYKTLDYVRTETASLAQQLVEAVAEHTVDG